MKHTPYTVVSIITKLELGGAQKVCLTLFHGLHHNNHTAFLISGNEGTLVNNVIDNPQVILLPSLKREVGLKTIVQECKAFMHLIRVLRSLKKKNPDLLVHTHSTKAGLIGRWAAFFAGIRHRVHTVHGFGFHPHQSWIPWLLTYVLELITSFITTHYVCVSSADMQTGSRLFPFFARRSSIIRAAVDWETFYQPARSLTPFPADTQPFIFGTVSCFKKQKNLFDLLYAFEWVHQQNPRTRLELVGDGTLRPALESWIAEHNLAHVITLHGWQHHVAPFMMSWHVFVLSSLWEGLPCAVVEARLLKLPVLSYDTGGIRDVIHSNKNGFLYPQKEWRSLAKGMLTLSQQPILYQALQASPDDLQEFHDQTMIKKHIELYSSLISSR